MSSRKGQPPARPVSEDTASDWLFDGDDSEDGDEISDNAEAGPSSGQTLVGGSSATSQRGTRPKKKRKRNPDGVIYARKKPKVKQPRTVSVDVVKDVRQHPVWKACYKKCLAIMNDSKTSIGTAAANKAERSLTKLQEEGSIWGVIENMNGSGPCAECLSKGAECLVQLADTGSGFEITSNCMGCYITYKSCDAYTGYNSRKGAGRKTGPQSEARPPSPKPVTKPKSSRPPPSRERPVKPPATKARESKAADRPEPAAPEPERTEIQPPTPRKSTTSAASNLHALKHPPESQSEDADVRPEEVASALNDLKDFADTMSGMLKERDQLDFRTRGMMKVVEEQIEVLRRFAESDR